jgi:transcriptional antiterminator RfaH
MDSHKPIPGNTKGDDPSCLNKDLAWYVIRTKHYKERVVTQRAALFVQDVYLPLLKTKRRGLGRLIERIEPLFPCYIFARLKLNEAHYRLMHSPGVTGIVCCGTEPCEVDPLIVEDIKSREVDGVIVLGSPMLRPQQRVTIMEGVFCGIEAVFERYLSSGERVAVLFDTIGRGNMRAILRVSAIAPH